MGMYIYVTDQDTKRMKSVKHNKDLNELFQEALKCDDTLLIEEQSFYKLKKGYKGKLLGQKEEHFRYSIYHESRAFDGSSYQARYMFAANNSIESIKAYLYGIINGYEAK